MNAKGIYKWVLKEEGLEIWNTFSWLKIGPLVETKIFIMLICLAKRGRFW
jgi:hypothetical protein